MSRAERTANLMGVVVPFLGVLAAIVLLWNRAVDVIDLAIMAVMYLITAVGITVGFHRLLTHRAFQTHAWLERTFAVLGSLSVQGSVMDWVADHRKHHAHTDREGDPHSPHVGHGSGLAGSLARPRRLAARDPGPGRLEALRAGALRGSRDAPDRAPLPAAGRCLAAGPDGGRVRAARVHARRRAAQGLVWGGLVRIFFVHHITWSVNSVCHFFGSRRFDVEDHSTNVGWLALLSLGESWHHNHHAFPRSAYHGLRWWELDPSGLIISGMERVGLAWNVVRITPERQRARTLAGVGAQASRSGPRSSLGAIGAQPGDHQLGALGGEAGCARLRSSTARCRLDVEVVDPPAHAGRPCAGGARSGRRRARRRPRCRSGGPDPARRAARASRTPSESRCRAARRGPRAGSRRRSRGGRAGAARAGSRGAAGWRAGRGCGADGSVRLPHAIGCRGAWSGIVSAPLRAP